MAEFGHIHHQGNVGWLNGWIGNDHVIESLPSEPGGFFDSEGQDATVNVWSGGEDTSHQLNAAEAWTV